MIMTMKTVQSAFGALVRRTFICMLTLIIFVFACTLVTYGQEDEEPSFAQIGVSTMRIELSADAGTIANGSFEVYNFGASPERVFISTADWDQTEDGQYHILSPGTLEDVSIHQWITLNPLKLDLEPGDRQTVEFELAVPEREYGAHWGMILVKSAPQETNVVEGENGFTAKYYASKTYGIKVIQAPKSGITDARIVESKVNVFPTKGCTVSSKVENLGTTYVAAKGKVDLINSSGEIVHSQSVPELKILPGRMRVLEVNYDNVLDKGDYVAVTVLDFGGEHLVGAQAEFSIVE